MPEYPKDQPSPELRLHSPVGAQHPPRTVATANIMNALMIMRKQKPCREMALAITKLEEGMFWLHRIPTNPEDYVGSIATNSDNHTFDPMLQPGNSENSDPP